MTHVFGPVPSRRLGRSLGVDMIPYKTCTYDCVYCQIGATDKKVVERDEWIPLETVLEELEEKLDSKPDYITISGSGEPTLYSRLGELIGRIKAMTDIPVAVLTNGSLLWREDVRRDLLEADLVVPSLDAASPAQFLFANRPHKGVTFDKMVEGLIAFREEFTGEIWLEILVLGGHTDTAEEIAKLVRLVKKIRPDRVQLNTVTRPPAEDCAIAVSKKRLEAFAELFEPVAEVVADFRGVHQEKEFQADKKAVLETLSRRPCSVEDISNGLGLHRNEVVKYLEELLEEAAICPKQVSGRTYYEPSR